MVAQCVNMVPDELIWVGGDCHIYNNHLDAAKEVIARQPMALPTLKLTPGITDIFAFGEDDIVLESYEHHDAIKLKVSI